MGSKVLVAGARAASELDNEALAHEVGTILRHVRRVLPGIECGGLHTESCTEISVCSLCQPVAETHQERRHERPWHPCTR